MQRKENANVLSSYKVTAGNLRSTGDVIEHEHSLKAFDSMVSGNKVQRDEAISERATAEVTNGELILSVESATTKSNTTFSPESDIKLNPIGGDDASDFAEIAEWTATTTDVPHKLKTVMKAASTTNKKWAKLNALIRTKMVKRKRLSRESDAEKPSLVKRFFQEIVQGTESPSAVTEQETETPITGKETVTSTGKEAITRITGMETDTPITGEETVTSTGKETITLITGMETATAITGKETVTPTGNETITPITGEETESSNTTESQGTGTTSISNVTTTTPIAGRPSGPNMYPPSPNANGSLWVMHKSRKIRSAFYFVQWGDSLMITVTSPVSRPPVIASIYYRVVAVEIGSTSGNIRYNLGFNCWKTQRCDFELLLNPYFVQLSFTPSFPMRQFFIGGGMAYNGQPLSKQPDEVLITVLGPMPNEDEVAQVESIHDVHPEALLAGMPKLDRQKPTT